MVEVMEEVRNMSLKKNIKHEDMNVKKIGTED